jgi:hypothetical protein
MKVVLQSIYAGPDGCADAGQIIDLPTKEAKRLIKEGGAKEVKDEPKRARSARDTRGETEDLQLAQAAVEAALRSPLAILGAIQMLDPESDQDWDEDGKPSLDRLQTLMESGTLTREEVDRAAPDALRPLPEPAPAQADPGDASGDAQDKAAAKPAASGSGARSNKP